jgi:Na+/H+ antiporter NhaD/arsenite permease-like protein
VTAIIILAATYLVVALGRVPPLRLDRAGAAIVGAVLMIATGAIGFQEAVDAVDARTLVLLFSMMVIVAHLRLSGGLAALARLVGTRVASPAACLTLLVFVAGVASALFVNDTICLVFTPVVLDVAASRREPPMPYLLALATASNIGSAATVTGNPQNIYIGSVSWLSFAEFLGALGPVAGVGLLLDAALIWLLYRRAFTRAGTPAPAVRARRLHRPLLWKTLVVTAFVLAGFLAGFDTALVASSGAAALLVTRRVKPRKVYTAVDWDLLMLFAGLFVVVAGGVKAGVDIWVLEWLRPLGVTTVAGLSATAAIVSNAISNVPAVLLLAKMVPQLPDPPRAWLALAMSSTLAGNLTILGSIANLIVVEGARRRGVLISFREYARVGVPITLLTVAWGVLWLSR